MIQRVNILWSSCYFDTTYRPFQPHRVYTIGTERHMDSGKYSQTPYFVLFSGCLTYLTTVYPPCRLPSAPKKGGPYLFHCHTLDLLGSWQGIPLLLPEVSSSLAGVSTGDFTGFKALFMVQLLRRSTNGTSSQGEISFCYMISYITNSRSTKAVWCLGSWGLKDT